MFLIYYSTYLVTAAGDGEWRISVDIIIDIIFVNIIAYSIRN